LISRKLAFAVAAASIVVLAGACSGSDDSGDPSDSLPQSRSGTGSSVATASTVAGDSTNTSSAAATTTTTTEAPTTTEPPTTTTSSTSTTTTTTTIPAFDPVEFGGTGTDIVILDSPIGRNLAALISYEGEGVIEVGMLDSDGERIDGLIDTAGPYTGIRFFEADDEELVSFLEVETVGDWSIRLIDVEEREHIHSEVGEVASGTGDDVVGFETDVPRVITFSCPECTGQVLVRVWTDGSRDTIIDEDGAFDGRQIVPVGHHVLEIRTSSLGLDGGSPNWTLTVEE